MIRKITKGNTQKPKNRRKPEIDQYDWFPSRRAIGCYFFHYPFQEATSADPLRAVRQAEQTTHLQVILIRF